MRYFWPVAALLLTAVPTQAAPANCPDMSLKRAQAVVTTARGVHRYTVEVAATSAQQECGLMFRRALARNKGMVFPFTPARPTGFWMENTYVALDIIFVGADGRVLNVAANAAPLSRTVLSSVGDTATVVELAAGEAARIGLKPRDRITLSN